MDAREQLRANLRQFDKVVAEATEYFRQQPDQSAPEETPWRAKEVLAHLLFWHERTSQNIADALAGKEPPPLSRPVDEVNAEAIAGRRAQPMSALVDQLTALQQRLLAAFQALDDPHTVVLVRPNGAKFSALERVEMLIRHINSHLDELRAV